MRGLAIALLLAACGQGSSGTAVRLEVGYEEAWSLTGLDVAAETEHAETTVATTVVVLVPDGWAARAIEIQVVGLRGSEPWATGRVTVTPELGREVRAEVTLSRLPCGAWCTPGALACSGDGTIRCELEDDCPAWSAPIPCPAAAPACSFGACAATCVDECAAGEARCAGSGAVERCGQADSDPCRDWLPALACGDGETCSLGQCRGACVDECEAEAVTCAGNGTSRCGDRDADGCREWGPPIPCPTGETCSAGVCAAGCTDECDAASCDGLLHRPCGQFDLDPCTDRAVGTSCLTADPCQEGACTAAGCLSAPRVCEDAPPASCVDANTLRTYDVVGTCAEGTCHYVAHDRACPGCPACDACAGVVCDQPPSPCHASSGTCEAGACHYGYADGATCSDGDACTGGDQCVAGACGGTPVSCTTPPPATCADGVTRRVFLSPGACGGGSCSYPSVDSVCPSACSGGACVCAESSCAAEALGSGETGGRDVALDATHIYWATSSGEIWRRPRGGGSTSLFVDGQGSVNRIVLDGTYVYWAAYDGAAVRRRPKAGGSVEDIVTGTNGYLGLAVDDIHVYWGNNLSGAIQRRAKAGGSIETLATNQGGGPVRVAVDATHVYFTNQLGNGDVLRVPKGGGAIETFAEAVSARELLLDGDVVYWSDGFSGNALLQRRSKSGGGIQTFAIESDVSGLTADENYVYWGNRGDVGIRRRHKLSGNVEDIPLTPGNTFDVELDAGHLYWITRGPPYAAGRLSRCACAWGR